MSETTVDYRALMTKALLEIKDLKARVQRHEDERAEPIAVIGMACRFPGGANSPDLYWNLLRDGVDAISEVPAERWDIERLHDTDRAAAGKMTSRFGGFIDDVSGFDAGFFGISPREAESLDPHQRVLLEVCWEALEHANLVPEDLFGSNAGVFIGVSSMDQVINQMGKAPLTEIGPYHGTGCAMAPIAGRVSYNFGFNGPSFVVDTACSSSLLSLHLAAESLRRRECNLALGGGVHLLFHPGYSVAFSKAGMLSVDGRCKTFDAAADGYVRGEGCGVVVLKRLSDAKRDGDPIIALLRGSAVNQDGASGGLTVPSGPSQEQVVRQALARGGIDASRVSYVETHGTGTPLGDPIELGALSNVFKQPLMVGSVKSNIGHLEASAGIASAIKVVLALQHKTIPPHLHLRNPNPLIPWQDMSISVPTRLTHWTKSGQGERVAGISAFGFSGTNVHMLLSEPPAAAQQQNGAAEPVMPRLLALSARSQEALRALAGRWADGPLADPEADVAALCATVARCRTPFAHRLAIVAGDAVQARNVLTEFARQGIAQEAIGANAEGTPSVAFLFTGQGSQYVGMGVELYRSEPVFRDAVDACDRLLQPELGLSLVELLCADVENDEERARRAALLDATANTQPALFMIEYALARLWQSFGAQPSALLGHSVGEYVAAHLAGVFSLEDGLRLIAARGRLMQALPAGGAMAAVLADPHQVEAAVAELGSESSLVSIAAYNGPRNTVVSGPAAMVEQVIAHFRQEGIECRPLAVSHAFHSPLMEPMLDGFRRVAAGITYHAPRLPVISNITGLRAGAELATAEYWVRHVLAPVRFSAGVQELVRQGHALMIEVGPSSTLAAMARQNVDDPAVIFLSSMRKGKPQRAALMAALGEYWANGGMVEWSAVNGTVGIARRDIRLPTYPFAHRNYGPLSGADASRDGLHGAVAIDHPLLARRFNSPLLRETLFETVFSKKALPFLEDHRVFGQLVVAGASHLSLILSAAAMTMNESAGGTWQFTDVMFPMALVVPEEGERVVQLSISPRDPPNGGTAPFRLVSLSDGDEANLHATGHIGNAVPVEAVPDLRAIWLRCNAEIPVADVYELQSRRHIVVGPGYQWLTALRRGQGETIATLCAPAALSRTIQRYSLHPGLIDSCFGALVMAQSMDVEETFIPFSVAALHVSAAGSHLAATQPLVAHAVVRQHDALRLVGDIHLYSEQGQPVAAFIGLEGRRASRTTLLAATTGSNAPAQYRVGWEALAPSQSTVAATGRWLILDDGGGIGARLAADLRVAGAVAAVASADPQANGLQDLTGGRYALAPASAAAFTQLLAAGPGFDAVVYLWGAAMPMNDPADFDTYQESACAGALHLLQALAGQAKSTRIWLATRGAQAVLENDTVLAPQQALLWGLGQVAAAEHGELACVCVDLDPAASVERCAADLLAASRQDAGETRLAVRGEGAYTARLLPVELSVSTNLNGGAAQNSTSALITPSPLQGEGRDGGSAPKSSPSNLDRATPSLTLPLQGGGNGKATIDPSNRRNGKATIDPYGRGNERATIASSSGLENGRAAIDPDATYLITGASGALGRELVAWLVQRGVRHLALVSRNPADSAWMADLAKLGAQPRHYQADVADLAALTDVFARIAQSQPVLGGIFHLAGMLDDGVITSQTWERWTRVLAPKARGAWNLHQLTRSMTLPLFVSFSSVASLLGTAGQASYAAANAFTDALAHHRHGAGLQALSVNWGPWAEVGMASRLDAGQQERLASVGISTIGVQSALDMLGKLIDNPPSAQIAVLAMAWQRYGQAYPTPFLNHLARLESQADDAGDSLREQLRQAAPAARKAMLLGVLSGLVADVLRLRRDEVAPRERLFDLGVDSLIALELKNRLQAVLGMPLSTTLLFDYPTIEALTDYLLGMLVPALAERQHAGAGAPVRITDEVEDLSEEEAESMLLAQLEQLEGRLS